MTKQTPLPTDFTVDFALRVILKEMGLPASKLKTKISDHDKLDIIIKNIHLWKLEHARVKGNLEVLLSKVNDLQQTYLFDMEKSLIRRGIAKALVTLPTPSNQEGQEKS